MNKDREETILTVGDRHIAFVKLTVPNGVNAKTLLRTVNNEISRPGFEDFHVTLSRVDRKVLISKGKSTDSPLETLARIFMLRMKTRSAIEHAKRIDYARNLLGK